MNITTSFSSDLELLHPNGSGSEGPLTTLLSASDREEQLIGGDAVGYNNDQNPPFPLYLRVWATLLSIVIFVVGVGGNLLVPILVWKNRQLRHSTNIFLLNLALADCLVLLICLPTAMVELHTAPNAWILGEALCRLVPFVEVSVVRASVFTLTVISLERYIAICKPLRASTLCTRPRALGVCIGIWPASFLAAGPVLVATEYQEPSASNGSSLGPTCMTPLHEPWVSGYFLGSAVAFFLLPLLFLSSIYFFIAKRLLNHRARSNKNLDTAHWNTRKQVAAMLGAVVLIFFVCLLPFQVFIVWVILSSAQDISDVGPHAYFNILFACRVLVYINAAANPVVYNAMSAKFRHALLRLFGRRQKLQKTLRRRSTLTTTFSSSSNASTRSNSFRRIANLALKRSLSDASIRRPATGQRFSSPSVLSSPKGSPVVSRAIGKWYLKRNTSGSYFSGDSFCSFPSEDSLLSSPFTAAARLKAKSKYSPLQWHLQNGYLQDRNRSLPELFLSSPNTAKRVCFKDSVLPQERPRAISPLAFNSLTDKEFVTAASRRQENIDKPPLKDHGEKRVGKKKTEISRVGRKKMGISRMGRRKTDTSRVEQKKRKNKSIVNIFSLSKRKDPKPKVKLSNEECEQEIVELNKLSDDESNTQAH